MSNVSESLSKDFLHAAKNSILFTTQRPEIVMERGQGMYLWDTEGKQYLDFVGGWAVTSLGHSPEVIAQALERQSRLLVNASPAFYNTSMLKFAKLLTDISWKSCREPLNSLACLVFAARDYWSPSICRPPKEVKLPPRVYRAACW